MKKIEITPVNYIIALVIQALNDLEIGGLTLTPVVNMGREGMKPRYGDWDLPPPPDYRTKIEIVVTDDQVDQVIKTIQCIVTKINFNPPRDYGNEIFVSSLTHHFDLSWWKWTIHENAEPTGTAFFFYSIICIIANERYFITNLNYYFYVNAQ